MKSPTQLAGLPGVNRRSFIGGVLGAAAFGALAPACTTTTPPWNAGSNPFTLGVASGDPLPDSVILWTRLALDPLAVGGAMPSQDVAVTWQVSTSPGFSTIAAQGQSVARPGLAHSVHVDAKSLAPGATYYYRFTAGGYTSPTGRTRTAPAPGAAVSQLRFAFASCQNYADGFYNAHGYLANEDVDVVVFLGDYIYESGVSGGARSHLGGAPVTLDDYRVRHAQYKTDTNLQAAHARFPWILTWDDHEVVNNYAGGVDTATADLARRAAAYQAYYEHLPIRVNPPNGSSSMQLFRKLGWGSLASFTVLDLRQYRTNQPCVGISDVGWDCNDAHSANGTILGANQKTWLQGVTQANTSTWNVFANSVIISPTQLALGLYNHDQWDGYTADRDFLGSLLLDNQVSSPVFVTGDVHANAVGEVGFRYLGSDRLMAPEFIGTSMSTGPVLTGLSGAATGSYIKWVDDSRRGYQVCTVTPSAMVTEYKTVDTIASTTSSLSTQRTYQVGVNQTTANLV